MSTQYDDYIVKHVGNVRKGFDWLRENLPHLFAGVNMDTMDYVIDHHDISKYHSEEYAAYDAYFYGKNRSQKVLDDFNKAWLHHIHNNKHHWQHWVLINDDAKEGVDVLDMPFEYIIEMICDWWAFSWIKGDLTEIFSWYKEHNNIKFSDKTRWIVEKILDEMKAKIQELEGEKE